ncbi:transcriptional regulator [Novosphingobium sp. PC22D]|uniref:helix-turn-helix domain-containing protein n=1 Tax=Novosphingobium sp. PC22D TaxID=1962403 RepID=UPI000BEF8562|nr:helix-turn-helix transcriptional regulator [Novosphingobium sp. PC22D]PEQ10741.1 transcriptional regulator [Novosphingobium sp. PC22D]
MINRIRDVRKAKGLTLADVAARCTPPTTAQTVGRLETGTRTLSLDWMNRIGAALDVEPTLLVRGEEADGPKVVARLIDKDVESIGKPREAVLHHGSSGDIVVIEVEVSSGEYRAGDQIWLRMVSPEDLARHINRDVLVARAEGRFAFGRLFDSDGPRVGVLPLGTGQRQIVIEHPLWIAVAYMLVRTF